ncbi:MAG TPA: MG2 domain-containing protein, partial [Chitinophagaceae bacterium]|nr:MG2 domain-containing protein [Chitinophagaceae bacterium]
MSKYLAIAFLLLQLNAYSQQPTANTWRYIDSSLIVQKNIGDIDSLVRQLGAKAMADKNYFTAARCYQYRITIADMRSEDSFYFRNSAVIDSVLQTSNADPSLQLAMHLLQAKRLFSFTTRNQRYDRISYQSKDIAVDYATYKDEQLDSIALHHFDEAMLLAGRIPLVSTEQFTWLSTDPTIFFFRPSIKDVVMAEHIRAIGNSRDYWRIDGLQDRWMSLSPDAFIEKMDSAAHDSDKTFEVLKQYHRWLQLHRDDPAAYYYIESLARKHFSDNGDYLSDLLTEGVNGENAYEAYLEKLLSSPYNMIKAHAVYQLCIMRFKQSQRYSESAKASSWSSYGYGHYDTAYRYHADKALDIFEQHKTMLDSFAYVKNDLLLLEKEIRKSQYNIRIANINIPGEPLLAELDHKNVSTLYYRIIKRDSLSRGASNYEQRHARRWLRFPSVVQQQIVMPATNDHNEHISYLKLDPLKPGLYALLFSSRPFTDTSAKIESVLFDVSSIALVQNDKTSFIVDRKTGMPLKNAIARASAEEVVKRNDGKKITKTIFQTLASNEQGLVQFTIKNNIKEIRVAHRGDTLIQTVGNDYDDDVAEQSTMDDRITGFMSDTRAYIYTDRAIYRPGQTVYYKIVFTTKDQKTRKDILATKNNLGLFGGKSVYDAWLKEYEPVIYIKDPFARSVDTIPVKISEFGSMSGSFRIPKNAATGQWEFGGEGFDVNYGSYIRIEEYKRPAYEISIDNPETELYPKDSFRFKIKVRSFAGAELANVRVKYIVERKGDLPVIDIKTGRERAEYITDTILNAAGFTNEKGELPVMVYDTALLKKIFVDTLEWAFNYNIDAEATDETGESHTASNAVRISTRPIAIMVETSDPLNRNKKMFLPVSTEHSQAGAVKKNITIKISRDETPVKVKEQRRLSKTDIWLYSKQQLQQWFPYTDFDLEEIPGVKKQVFETTVNTGNTKEIELDTAAFTPGHYTVEVSCNENGRIIGENKVEFDVYDENRNILPKRSLYTGHLYNSYLLDKSDTIKYLHGNSETPAYSVYQLVYLSGKNKTEKRIIHTSIQQPGVHVWNRKLPADANDEAYFMHFYVLNNEIYSKTQQITINSHDSLPKIVIERFRRKMAPGQKETFSVSLKSNEIKPIAEIVATLYDATLDKLADHSWDIPNSYARTIPGYWQSDLYRVAEKAMTYTGNSYTSDWGSLREHSWSNPLWWVNPGDMQTIETIKYTPPLFVSGGNYMYDANPDFRFRNVIRGGLWANNDYYLNNGLSTYGWGGGIGLTGTVGVTFNNFSVSNIFGKSDATRFTYML